MLRGAQGAVGSGRKANPAYIVDWYRYMYCTHERPVLRAVPVACSAIYNSPHVQPFGIAAYHPCAMPLVQPFQGWVEIQPAPVRMVVREVPRYVVREVPSREIHVNKYVPQVTEVTREIPVPFARKEPPTRSVRVAGGFKVFDGEQANVELFYGREQKLSRSASADSKTSTERAAVGRDIINDACTDEDDWRRRLLQDGPSEALSSGRLWPGTEHGSRKDGACSSLLGSTRSLTQLRRRMEPWVDDDGEEFYEVASLLNDRALRPPADRRGSESQHAVWPSPSRCIGRPRSYAQLVADMDARIEARERGALSEQSQRSGIVDRGVRGGRSRQVIGRL